MTLETFGLNGWSVTSIKRPIATQSESQSICEKLGFPHPTMMFPENTVIVSGPTVRIEFNSLDSIYAVKKKSPEDIKVIYSQEQYWQDKQKQYRMELDYDWTYQSDYQGSVTGAAPQETEETIDYDKLRASTGWDFRFYDDNCLWEDEMGDNGTSVFTVKTRVLDYGIYILARSFVRVDNVKFKSMETRYWIDFAKPTILQETRRKEDSFELVMAMAGRNFLNDSLVADMLAEIERNTVKLI